MLFAERRESGRNFYVARVTAWLWDREPFFRHAVEMKTDRVLHVLLDLLPR